MRNRGYRYEERLGKAVSGLTALAYLAKHYPHSSRDAWRQRIESGRVSVDGEPVAPSTPLSPGGILAWNRPPWVEPAAPASFAVLYRDEDVVAVAKPRGLAAMPGGGFLEKTLLRRVLAFDSTASPLHRLGRGTSGITLFARHPAARRALTNAWQRGGVERKYVGLVDGTPRWRETLTEARIGPVPHARLGHVAGVNPNGKLAKSHVHVIEARASTSLVEVTIETGRTHQIRIHLAALGYPLAGDPLYPVGGVPDPRSHAFPGDPGFFLHAHWLRFPHPSREGRTTVSCIPPPILREGGS